MTQRARRILSIWLRRLSVDRWRRSRGLARGEGADCTPIALIGESARAVRIEALNEAAEAIGLRAGMTLADARAICPDLAAYPADPAGDLALLEKIALWAQRWGPWSALDPPDGVIVDVGGVAHLFGGEDRLLADVVDRFEKQGLSAACAIAPTAGAAWALSHYARPMRGAAGAVVAGKADLEIALGPLPVAALRLDSDVCVALRRLGLKRIEDVARIGRDALQRRFRNRRAPAANPLVRLDQLFGRVPEPILPIIARDQPLAQRRLIEPIRHRALLEQVLGDLVEDLRCELEARGEGARRLDLGLWRVDGEVVMRRLELAAPSREAAHIQRLFAPRLEEIDAGLGIESLQLRASWTEPLELTQADIEEARVRHGVTLAGFLDRIAARLGASAARGAALLASHVPERAQRWIAPLDREGVDEAGGDWKRYPLKLLDPPEPIRVLYATPDGYPRSFRWRGELREVARVSGPERIAPEWWRERSSARLRDYYRIEDCSGRRYWIYRYGIAGDGRSARAPQWYLHGLFA